MKTSKKLCYRTRNFSTKKRKTVPNLTTKMPLNDDTSDTSTVISSDTSPF